MVGHEAIDRAEKAITCGGVKEQFPEAGVEGFGEPAAAAPGDRQRPVDDGIALVVFACQPGEIEFAVEIFLGHGAKVKVR